MKRIKIIFILMLMVFAAVPVGAAYADTLADRIIKEGEVVNEDVVVYGDNLIIEEGAIVNGDVVVFGGHAEVSGEINGDVAIFGGTVDLNGVVDGELVIFGGSLNVSESADVTGECALLGGSVTGEGQSNSNCTSYAEHFPFSAAESMGIPPIPPVPAVPEDPAIPAVPGVPELPEIPTPPTRTRISPVYKFFSTVGEITGRSLMLGLLALIVAALIPTQLNRVSDVLVRKPVASGTVGVLTAMAGPFAITLLAIISTFLIILCGLGLLGYPIILIVALAFGFGLLMGWIAVGTLLGKRLAETMKLTNRSLPIIAALGTVVLTLLTSAMSELPFLLGGWLWSIAAVVIASAGLGAVALTKFGTRAYPVGARTNSEKVSAVLETLHIEDTGDK